MALYQLLTYYVFQTAPVADVSFVFVMCQVVLQSLSPALLIYDSIRRRSTVERFMLCCFPMVFAVTYAIMDALLGSSFVGGGFYRIDELKAFLYHSGILREVEVILLVFPLFSIAAWYLGWGKRRWLPVLTSLPSWLLFFLSFAGTVYFFVSDMPLSEASEETLLLWYVYSIYAVLFQVLLNAAAILCHFLFSERKIKDIYEQSYSERWCRRQITRALLSGNKVILWTLLPLVVIIDSVFVWAFVEEGTSLSQMTGLQTFFLPVHAVLIMVLVRVIVPKTLPAVRIVYGWKDGTLKYRQFCQEYFNEAKPPETGYNLEKTEHFLLCSAPLQPALFYIPDIAGVARGRRGLVFHLKDGSSLEIPVGNEKDLRLVRGYMARQA